jgi:uncharacterized LabA/DUF88 family protein
MTQNTDMAVGSPNTCPGANTPGVFHFKTAIMVDGGWFSTALGESYSPAIKYPKADQIYRNAISVLQTDEILLKFFFYDSMPYSDSATNPISKNVIDFSKERAHHARTSFFRELGQMPCVALRKGDLRFRGWKLKEEYQNNLIKGTAKPLTEYDIMPDFEQKGVDMRIGIDMATLSLKRLVNRIILFSGDSDMLPAMKLARVEGVQIVIVQVGRQRPKGQLVEDSDYLRILSHPSI